MKENLDVVPLGKDEEYKSWFKKTPVEGVEIDLIDVSMIAEQLNIEEREARQIIRRNLELFNFSCKKSPSLMSLLVGRG